MIACTRCGKENQNHYKFCLGCGAELGPPAPAPAASHEASVGMMKTMMADPGATSGPAAVVRSSDVQPTAAPASGGYAGTRPPGNPLPSPAPFAAPAAGTKSCPSCGADVPVNFKFCGACGNAIAAAPAPAPSPAPTPAPVAAPAPRSLMTLIRPDGSEGGSFPLEQGENRIGRSHGPIFENDGYLSPTHATLTVRGTTAVVRDQGSLNGVFVRMSGEEEILPGQIVRLGQELLRFDLIEPPAPLDDGTEVMGSPNPGYWGKITVVIGKAVDGSAYPLLGDSVNLGRERGDINFPDDGYVSGLHARLTQRGGKIYLADLGSSNGTFVKIHEERALGHESYVLLGQQLFRLTLK